jgi:hypothetical protein
MWRSERPCRSDVSDVLVVGGGGAGHVLLVRGGGLRHVLRDRLGRHLAGSDFAVFQGTSDGGRQFVNLDDRMAILCHCMANLTVYLLKIAKLRTVDRHSRYP